MSTLLHLSAAHVLLSKITFSLVLNLPNVFISVFFAAKVPNIYYNLSKAGRLKLCEIETFCFVVPQAVCESDQ